MICLSDHDDMSAYRCHRLESWTIFSLLQGSVTLLFPTPNQCVRGTWGSHRVSSPQPLSQRDESSCKPQSRSAGQARTQYYCSLKIFERSRTSCLECELQDTSGGQAKLMSGCWTGRMAIFCIFEDVYNEDTSCIHLRCIYPSLLMTAWQTPNLEHIWGPFKPI